MLAVAFPAAAFATNCYVLATGPGQECLVVDPGIGVEDTLRDVLAEHRLRPAAVLLTHFLAERMRANPKIGRVLEKLAGVFLIGFGIKLAVSK